MEDDFNEIPCRLQFVTNLKTPVASQVKCIAYFDAKLLKI
jgi:hypothetical protein